jgi:hypothetical protein
MASGCIAHLKRAFYNMGRGLLLKLHAIWQEDDRRAKPLHQFEKAIVGGIREWAVRRKTLEFSVQSQVGRATAFRCPTISAL